MSIYSDYIKPVFDKIFYYLFENKPVFIIFLALFSLFVLISLVYCQIKGPVYPTATQISEYPLDRPIPVMPVEFNLAEGEFTEKEVLVIRRALYDWQKFSNNKVSFILNENWQPIQCFSPDFYETYEKNTVWMKTGDEEGVAKLFLKYSISAEGFAVGNFIVIINQFETITENKLYMIMKHEIGHKLGFEHIKKEYPALMNIGGNNGKFTDYDKIMFCELYDCDNKK